MNRYLFGIVLWVIIKKFYCFENKSDVCIEKFFVDREELKKMRYFLGVSCEEYKHYDNISFCHNDLFLLQETLRCFCDYS